MIKAVIIEDELKGLNNLKNLIAKYCEDVQIIGEANSIQEAQELFDDPDMKPDVAFLDISLPDGLVFQLLNELRPIDFEIIFVTAFHEYAIKACEYSSIGYIVKPIDPDLLQQAVQRIRPQANLGIGPPITDGFY
ncbi:MAG: response regulator, partial [Phaeodactylibacter sp.]|nr:response regulator [Phaeodactylibacter sp.]